MSETMTGDRGPGNVDGDIIVRELRHVERRYRELSEEAEVQRRQLDEERRRAAELASELTAVSSLLTAEQQRALRAERRRAELARHVQEVNRAVFQGDMYELILKACMTMTGATRGLYGRRLRNTNR